MFFLSNLAISWAITEFLPLYDGNKFLLVAPIQKY